MGAHQWTVKLRWRVSQLTDEGTEIADNGPDGCYGPVMRPIPNSLKLKLPFIISGFASFLFSVWLYFIQDQEMAGIFVGLWVPSIHSLGTLLLTPVNVTNEAREEAVPNG